MLLLLLMAKNVPHLLLMVLKILLPLSVKKKMTQQLLARRKPLQILAKITPQMLLVILNFLQLLLV